MGVPWSTEARKMEVAIFASRLFFFNFAPPAVLFQLCILYASELMCGLWCKNLIHFLLSFPTDNYSEEEYESFSSEQEASDDAVQGQVLCNFFCQIAASINLFARRMVLCITKLEFLVLIVTSTRECGLIVVAVWNVCKLFSVGKSSHASSARSVVL